MSDGDATSLINDNSIWQPFPIGLNNKRNCLHIRMIGNLLSSASGDVATASYKVCMCV